jgi:hypothetical protein
MNRRDSVCALRWPTGRRLARWVLGAALVGLAGLVGCTHQQTRLQSDDENEKDRYEVKTVRDVASVGNAEPVAVAGVGLVVGLEGTGGDTTNEEYRSMLSDALKKEGVKNIKELLSSPANALVLVSGQVPPGANKDDPIDLEVALPPKTRATSLRGGYLRKCLLFNYDFAGNLSQTYGAPNQALMGHKLVRAEGPVLVGFGDGDESAKVKQGRIWNGGHLLVENPFTLLMNPDQQYVRVASLVADRINDTFHATGAGLPGSGTAAAKNKFVVALKVPTQYRLNLPRFLRVVLLIPLREGAEKATSEGDRRPYRERLAADLLDPNHTVTAALRLEALGQSSVPLLKAGLDSRHPLVRFCAAEALAYLGNSSSAEVLAQSVIDQPLMRAYALTALASLDEAVSQYKLAELLTMAPDDETRYGAFRALRTLSENNPAVAGEHLNDSFWLHRVAPGSSALVHMTSTRRAEVVLFGDEDRLTLQAPFSFLAGEFAVTAGRDDPNCTVTRFPTQGSPARRQCSLKLEDVLRTMADLGGMYPEVVEFLRQADQCQCLGCRVRCDALPQAVSVYDLVKSGKDKPGKAGAAEAIPGGQDLGLTPTLFEGGRTSRAAESTGEERGAQRP